VLQQNNNKKTLSLTQTQLHLWRRLMSKSLTYEENGGNTLSGVTFGEMDLL
jgi:hypothetical protein